MTDPLIKTYSDKNIKFKYDEVQNSTVDPANAVGATTSATLRTLDFTPSDSNSIYVATTGSNANAGTSAAPVLTIAYALTICTATKTHIMIKDSGTYQENGINFTGDCVGIYAAIGQTPTLDILYYYTTDALTKTTDNTSITGVTFNVDYVLSESITLDDGNICNVSYTAASGGYNVIRVINSSTWAVIHETAISTQLNVHPRLVKTKDNDVIIIFADPGGSGTDGGWLLFDPDGGTVVQQDYSATNFVQATCGNPRKIAACRHQTNENYLVIAYKADYTASKVYGLIWDYVNDSVVQSGIELTDTLTLSTTSARDYGFGIIPVKNGTYKGGYGLFIHDNATYTISWEMLAADLSVSKAYAALVTNANYKMPLLQYCYSLFFKEMLDDNVLIIYDQAGTGSPYTRSMYIAAYDFGGSSRVAETTVRTFPGSSTTMATTATVLLNGTIAVLTMQSSTNIKYAIYTPDTTGYFIKMGKNMILDGLNITSSNTEFFTYPIEQSSYTLTAKYCTFYDFYDAAVSTIASGTGAVNVQNCIFMNCQKLFSSTTNSFTFSYNAVFFNTDGVQCKVTGSGSSVIFNHNTFFGNYQAIQLASNAGTEIIKNCIFRTNTNGAVTASTTLALTYCCVTDTYQTVTLGTGSITYNPQFIDEGLIDPDDIDLNLRSVALDYSMESPCIGADDSAGDMGCYDVDYTYAASTYTTITIPKPKEVDVELKAFNQIINEMQDGTIARTKDGNKIVLKLKWSGLKNEYANLIADLFDADGDVYVYLEPDTNPTTYYTMQVNSDNLSMSPKYFKQSKHGTQDVEIMLVGKYN